MAAAKVLTPHSEWCQDMDRLLIRIKLPDVAVADTKLDIQKDRFSFSFKNYHFEFLFRFPVNPTTVKYRSTQRDLNLIIEKETSNSYWPHLMPKDDKKKYKHHCQVDWNRFMDEDDAKKSKKGIVDDEDDYGNLGGMGMGMGDDESSSDDSDDAPIDDLEINPAADSKPDDAAESKEDEEAGAEAADAAKSDDKEDHKESAGDGAKGVAEPVNEEEALSVD